MIITDSITGKTHRLVHPSLYLAGRGREGYEVRFNFLGWQLHHESGFALCISERDAMRVVELMTRNNHL